MNILIVGGGTVGTAICTELTSEGHDITVIDKDMACLKELSNKCDVVGVMGNGAEVSTLREAGASKADLLIAVTSMDEVNIICCTAAKKLGTKHTVARVRNPEYAELMQLMKNEMNLSLTINPELAAAKEISRILRFPSANKVDTLARGRVELAEFVVESNSPLCDTSLFELRTKLNMKFLVCAVKRNGKAYIPSGNFVIKEGDTVCFTASDEEISKVFKSVGNKRPIKNVLIVGAGRITYYLQSMLKRAKIHSTVIDNSKQRCRELAENFDCSVICNDTTKQEVLLEEGLGSADAFLALSDSDEENAIVSMYAKSQSTQKIVTLISRISYVELFKNVGLGSIVSPKSSTETQILRYARSMANAGDYEIESIHKLMDEQVEALEFVIKEAISGFTNIPLKELKLRPGVLIACIVRDNRVIIPSGNDSVLAGDTVITVAEQGQIKGIKEIFR
ncbi:MAG: Trk system potassium transporter TrkA [Ruminococcaceae bacterium]|nr:Trk system potassium transporter TrkA [Oscillospiraceae bacterium]